MLRRSGRSSRLSNGCGALPAAERRPVVLAHTAVDSRPTAARRIPPTGSKSVRIGGHGGRGSRRSAPERYCWWNGQTGRRSRRLWPRSVCRAPRRGMCRGRSAPRWECCGFGKRPTPHRAAVRRAEFGSRSLGGPCGAVALEFGLGREQRRPPETGTYSSPPREAQEEALPPFLFTSAARGTRRRDLGRSRRPGVRRGLARHRPGLDAPVAARRRSRRSRRRPGPATG